jgi:hypothetical protein
VIFQIHFHTSIGAALNEIQQQLDCARQLSCGESHISKFFLEKKSCTGDILDQLYVTREAIEAYERRTGFQGIGQFMIDKGLFVMAEENLCKTA